MTTDKMLPSYLLSTLLTLSLTYSWYSFYGARIFFKFLDQEVAERKTRPNATQVVPVYMWDIYNNGINSSEIDIVRGIHPKFITVSTTNFRNHRRKQLEFNIPNLSPDEILTAAEVLITANALQNQTAYFQIYLKSKKWIFLDEKKVSNVSETWVSLRVTTESVSKPRTVTFFILTLFENRDGWKSDFLNPVLLLSYTSKNKNKLERRKRNSNLEDYEEETNMIWGSEKLPRRRNGCRRASLYVKFSDIDYDGWIVAPSGYEAFQCVGKCTFPLGQHLTPTKHAIVQTLLHNASPWKTSRACCVPTRLDPISLLYIDENGVLTFRFRYSDMVVAECGCR